MPEQFYCAKCNKTMDEKQFYKSHNLEKYPTGKLNFCKKCITMHVDNFDPDTYLWILQECDVPYVPEEWNKLMLTYGKDKGKMTGLTIIGRYLSKMALKQHTDYRWKDTEYLQDVAKKKVEETMKTQGYGAAEIAATLDKGFVDLPAEELEIPDFDSYEVNEAAMLAQQDDYFARQTPQGIEDEAVSELTEEDKRYLCLKWGKTYRPEEWIRLEQLYEDMVRSYEIDVAGDLNTLLLVCKCSLKANQLLDIGDIDGAQKVTKMYDSLMKSGKWTAAQNKANSEDIVDSVGAIVAICEKEGFIPRYYVDGPQDKVDRVIEDMQKYTHDLIINESGLGIMIENAMKQMKEEEERIRDAANQSEQDEEAQLFNYDKSPLTTQDYIEFSEYEDKLNKENQIYFDEYEEDDE